MPKISIVMPMLNSIKYLDECILSVLNQTIKDIEIIIVDAGSVDGTVERLQEYAGKDDRIKILVSDKKSMGYQYNMGIKAATGDYIGFVESDDYVVSDMYEKLLAYTSGGTVVWVKSDYYFFMEYPEIGRQMIPVKENRNICYGEVFNPQENIELYTKERYMWNGIYKRDFLMENQIFLNETPGAAYQDMGFFLQAYMYAHKAVYLEDCLYCYRRDNPGSSMHVKRSVFYTVNETLYVADIIRKKPVLYQLFWDTHCRNSYQYFRGFYRELLGQDEYSEEVKDAIERYRQFCLSEDYRYNNQEIQWLAEGSDIYDYKVKDMWTAEEEMFREQTRLLLSKERVAIMGCGDNGLGVLSLLLRLNQNTVICLSDNDSKKWGLQIMGIPVVSPQEMAQLDLDAIVIANANYVTEIKKQLEELSVPENEICIAPGIMRVRGTSILPEGEIVPVC